MITVRRHCIKLNWHKMFYYSAQGALNIALNTVYIQLFSLSGMNKSNEITIIHLFKK